jgi:hypothetical protein
METIAIIIGIVLILLLFGFIIWGRSREKKDWNNGYCSCGHKWRYFDSDSQGGRGYCCDNCNNYIWVSYKVDKNYATN